MARVKTVPNPHATRTLPVKEVVRRKQEEAKGAKGAPAKLLQCTAKNARCGKRCRRPVDPRFKDRYNQLCYVHAKPADWAEWRAVKASLPSAGKAYERYNRSLRALKQKQKREQTEGE